MQTLFFLLLLAAFRVESKLVVRSETTKGNVLPTTTASTTTDSGCNGATPFRRKNGWWCVKAWVAGNQTTAANLTCTSSHTVLGSIETDEEWKHWFDVGKSKGLLGTWMGIGKDAKSGKYRWTDGHVANTELPRQPVVINGGTIPTWIWNKTATSPPFGYPALMSEKDCLTRTRMTICGFPGKQFN